MTSNTQQFRISGRGFLPSSGFGRVAPTVSEAHRRSDTHRGQQRAQRPEPYRPTGQPDIDPGQAVEFRRRLDYQGSAELIPTAGPDAQADQGPAIKAVWEPEPPGASAGAGPGSRRQSRRTGAVRSGSGRLPGRAGTSKKRRRILIFGGAAAVAVAVVGIAGLSGGGSGPNKGSAATILPAASSAPADAAAANQSTGADASGGSPTSSASASASPSRTPSATHSASSSSSARPSATRGTATQSATPKPSPSKTTCFLFFCG